VTFISSSIKTPVGIMQLVADEHVLLGASFGPLDLVIESLDGDDVMRKINPVKRIPVISDLIDDYFDGDIEAINGIATRQPGPPFSQAAWKVMRKIKAGKVISYTELAGRAGSPAAVRAAGSACAKNAIVLVVPCHRVVKTGGALGNYAFGLDKKEWLLRHEGAL
jgi:methylated-DNA-[protein]-cysteine S-methyltransferase